MATLGPFWQDVSAEHEKSGVARIPAVRGEPVDVVSDGAVARLAAAEACILKWGDPIFRIIEAFLFDGKSIPSAKTLYRVQEYNIMKMTFFGNCQLRTISDIVSLVCENVQTEYLSNNFRTGEFKSIEYIYNTFNKSDVIIMQDLDLNHGKLSRISIEKEFDYKSLIILPYVFNSGITIISYAPMSPKFSYGEIFGRDEMSDILSIDARTQAIIAAIEDGNDLGSRYRFKNSMNELKKREANTNVPISTFFLENYQRQMLLLTHNHPTNILLVFIIERIFEILKIDYRKSALDDIKFIDNNLPYTGAPYIPLDKNRIGLCFGWHSDWKGKISYLAEILIRARIGEFSSPSVYAGIRLPDVARV